MYTQCVVFFITIILKMNNTFDIVGNIILFISVRVLILFGYLVCIWARNKKKKINYYI